jgi:hypothetical protein
VTARTRPLALLARTRPLALLALAGLCAAVVVLAGGPLRIVAGAVLGLYLPGRLAVLALFGRRVEVALGVTLTIALSLAALMLTGFAAALARRVEAPVVAAGLVGLCALLAAAAGRRTADDDAPEVSNLERPRRPARMLTVAAAVPLLALSALLAVRVADTVRHRSPDSYYTELSLESSGSGRPVAVVRSLERATTTFWYEERRDGAVVQAAQFTLRPGERTTIGLVSPLPGHVELVLYRADRAGAYRRVIP